MKKLDEKAFKILKVLLLFVVIIACGLYYVLFVDEELAKGMEITKIEEKEEVIETTKLVISQKKVTNAVDVEDANNYTESGEFIIEVEPIIEDVSTVSVINSAKEISENVVPEEINQVESIVENVGINQNGVVNINIASDDELQTLKNIGPVVASNIIAYRQENGNFVDIEDIKNVKGIGDAKFALIKDFICVK